MKELNKYMQSLPEGEYVPRKISPFGHVFRFIASWLGFTGLYAMFSVCPFCGQPGCPVGMASAGTIGAFFALCMQDWKLFFTWLRQIITRKKQANN